jgi:hypothetical protein
MSDLQKLTDACKELDPKLEELELKRTHSFGETCLVADAVYDGMAGYVDFSEITDEEAAAGKSPRVYSPDKIVGRLRRLLGG